MTKEDSQKPRIDTTVISGSYPRFLTILTSIEFLVLRSVYVNGSIIIESHRR